MIYTLKIYIFVILINAVLTGCDNTTATSKHLDFTAFSKGNLSIIFAKTTTHHCSVPRPEGLLQLPVFTALSLRCPHLIGMATCCEAACELSLPPRLYDFLHL